MRKIPIEPGKKFGRWTIIREGHRDTGRRRVLVQCECGTIKTIIFDTVRRGRSLSCGCWAREVNRTRFHPSIRKGRDRSTFNIWQSMRARCFNENNKSYPNYGGRGITVCRRWADSFDAFFEDMGERPKGLTLERIDNDGNYEPSNCRWATRREQTLNRRKAIFVTMFGERLPLIVWCERLNVDYALVLNRLLLGWKPEHALTVKVGAIKPGGYCKFAAADIK